MFLNNFVYCLATMIINSVTSQFIPVITFSQTATFLNEHAKINYQFAFNLSWSMELFLKIIVRKLRTKEKMHCTKRTCKSSNEYYLT